MAGVSKSTAARLFRNLGYSDFTEVRLQAREERNRTAPSHQATAANPAAQDPTDIESYLQLEVQNVLRTLETLRPDLMRIAADCIADAPRVWVLGMNTEDGLARYGRLALARQRGDVRLICVA